jgi:pyridinium-3,5-bisthiocarboxylic acid mononucleotide nickel chelatase
MSRLLYFDCFSGISGDMVLGALLDAGLPLQDLSAALRSLDLPGCEVATERVLRCGLAATKFRVFENGREVDRVPADHDDGDHRGHDGHHGHEQDHHGHDHSAHHPHGHADPHAHRSVSDILTLIDRSALSAEGRRRAKGLFERLAEAEASIHQVPVEEVHLHEVGAADSIIDIVGAVFALEWAGADQVVCSPLNVGGGTVRSAHGRFPVPAPATLRLLGDAPIYGGAVQKELVTPTGALIATSYASSFGPVPPMSIERVGYGAGDRDHPGTPNVLRVLVGRPSGASGDRVVVIECEIDDMNPQLFGSAMERLYAAGALEVFYVPVQMKKNRPGTLLTVVAPPRLGGELADVIFRETTTIGLRHYEVERECLEREVVSVETPMGAVRFKLARRNGRVINAVPEFEDCAALARQHGRSVKEVQAVASGAYAASRQSREGGAS